MIAVKQRSIKIALFIFFIGFFQSLTAVGLPFGQGLLFQITAPDGRVAHLFGTIHSDDLRVQRLPEPVDRVFVLAERLALEINMEPAVVVALMVAMVNADGRTLESIIGAELYRRLVTIASTRGMPEVGLRQYKPWAVATMLSMPPAKTGQFLDLLLFHRAQTAGIEVVGLETVEEQLAVFEGLSEEQQVALLKDVLNNFAKMPIIHEKLLTLYIERDLQGLVVLNDSLAQGEEKALMAHFQQVLIDDRNERMVERMETHMIEGLFVAVGALHLPGPKGILSLLQQRGYKIQRVY